MAAGDSSEVVGVDAGEPERSLDSAALGHALESTEDVEERIDAIAAAALSVPPDAALTPLLLKAFGRAQSALGIRSVALAIAGHAAKEDRPAVEALTSAYAAHSTDAFLGAALLDALSLYGLRSPLARAGLTVELLTLDIQCPRYVLVAAARVIGRLCASQPDGSLREVLKKLADVDDPSVRSEARYQEALMLLADTLLAPTRAALPEQLAAAHAAFAGAQAYEEHRPDAAMFMYLIDILLVVDAMAPQYTEQLESLGNKLRHAVTSISAHDWHGYRSDMATLRAARLLDIADAFMRIASAADDADTWTNFDTALVDLAVLLAVLQAPSLVARHSPHLDRALQGIGATMAAPRLGPILTRSVGHRRFALVIERYVRANGEDLTAVALQSLLNWVGDITPSLEQSIASELTPLARVAGESDEEAAQGLFDALKTDTVNTWARRHSLREATLLIDRPDLYGGDPAVDEAVRQVLGQLRTKLAGYPATKWTQLVRTLEAVMAYVNCLRDDLPAFTRRKEDGGLGQDASERDLQDALFGALRQRFGRGAIYERVKVAGGRSDTGLEFPECSFPIEVKAEYISVDRAHVRTSFISQPDLYAAARDRVCVLVILDLRSIHATDRRGRQRRPRPTEERVSLYTLREGLWIDALPVDPQIEGAQSKAVIVVLVPGNQPLPSHLTAYSRRHDK